MNEVPLRAPETVLRLDRMGSFHQTRLSFMRVLLRRLARENWHVERVRWEIGPRGEGVAVYEARGPQRTYSLIAYGHDLDPAKRTDRVIAEEWDATFVLHDGVASDADIERLARNVPKQEAGRCTAAELVMARANRSVRIFDHVVETLSAGRQPLPADLDAVGYLMRTTAVYGSGKFGLSDYERIAARPEFSGPFAAEMLTVWLIRAFTTDLAEHLAQLRAPGTAVAFDPALRRRLGVGNSTGLGMAPFVVNHPALFHRWIAARETALARVRSIERPATREVSIFFDRLRRGMAQMEDWTVDDAIQMARINSLRADLDRMHMRLAAQDLSQPRAWDRLYRYAEENLGLEAQEFLVTLLLEPYGELVDDLATAMAGDDSAGFRIDGSLPLSAISETIESDYSHALALDFTLPQNVARFWYTSEEKLEPRLGERAREDGAGRELPLAAARDMARLHMAISKEPADISVANFLVNHPEHRHAVRRAQIARLKPYAEIRDNIVGAAMRPIDILRCKLSFFGATDFNPRSDRWVRISMFRHAPFPDELHRMDPDDWAIPPLTAPALGPQPASTAPKRAANAAVPEGYSLNEIEAQIRKAARGAGLEWGLAEEAGKIGRRLAAHDPSQLGLLADALNNFHAGNQATALTCRDSYFASPDSRPLSPFILGPALADHGRGEAASPVAYRALLGLYLDRRPLKPVVSVAIPDRLWQRFDKLAMLTYVPASTASRLTGAGAGLTDND